MTDSLVPEIETHLCSSITTFQYDLIPKTMARGGFHVEFGINETLLTQYLEKNDYISAERLIRETANPSYLDEGCYQRTPLYIVLCGLDEEELNVKPRNLFLAKLCIERGANVNHRVPKVSTGSEFLGPGKSPIELIIDFYNVVTRYLEWSKSGRLSASECWNPNDDIVIGFSNKIVNNLYEVKEICEQLVFTILATGGEPNIKDEDHQTPLHTLAIRGFDIEMAKLLCENEGDINAIDQRHNSPLLCLLDISISESDYKQINDLSPTSSDNTLEDNVAIDGVKKDFFYFFINQCDIDLNVKNHKGQTALFHCVIRADTECCHQLLIRNTDPSIRATVIQSPKQKQKLSPLFCVSLSFPSQRSLRLQHNFRYLVQASRKFSFLVDSGYFSTDDILKELGDHLKDFFPEFINWIPVSIPSIQMLFGQTTASLKQLAVRVIFQEFFCNNISYIAFLMEQEARSLYENVSDIYDRDIYEEFINTILDRKLLQRFLFHFSLPQNSLLNFLIELLFHRMLVLFSSFYIDTTSFLFEKQIPYDSSSDDSDFFANEGDSDLEYW
ncbi:uncharacterized protein LOC115214915 isoform X1 [Octopus sinensis]|uniref:Uncharacterized protein LOC115214915 isoform X1 n=2 Tax=Octopus sinensis TaxID=2607531 RepID=A0A7E6EM50_9MOLL|nr:uncharacterized protein LOC115214915 isoform X1 [Octopus sinensis]